MDEKGKGGGGGETDRQIRYEYRKTNTKIPACQPPVTKLYFGRQFPLDLCANLVPAPL